MGKAADVGTSGAAQLTVTAQDTAIALRSGDVPVLATPRLIALMEEATCEALSGSLDPHLTSVGTAVEVVHRRPTPLGARVHARARVASVEGSRIVFDVTADHETVAGERVESIARGQITRVIVDRDAFGE